MALIDAILHIADLDELALVIAALDPSRLDETGTITGWPVTPAVRSGPAALVYVRVSEEDADQWRDTPGVTVLAELPHHGPGTADDLYAALFADPQATSLYDAVYDRSPRQIPDGSGGSVDLVPPARFAAIW